MSLRDDFLLEKDLVFLNHGSFGACPAPVFDVYQQWQRDLEANPVAFLGRRSAALLDEALGRLADYLGAEPANLVFVTNATTGVNVVLRSLDLRPGDEILTTDHEYGACDNLIRHVCQRTGARDVRCPIDLPYRGDDAFVEAVWSHVGERTRLIFLSHLTSRSALILPVDRICRRARRAGIMTLIDGAHAPGQLDLRLEDLGADFYTGNAHKWLCAPKGAAFLHVRPSRHETVDAGVIGWGYSEVVDGRSGFDAYTACSTLRRRHLWQGTRDIAAFLSVPAAIDYQRRNRWPEVRRRCGDLAWRTQTRVQELLGLEPIAGRDNVAQMVAMPVPSCDAEAVQARLLEAFRIEIPITEVAERQFVRVSVQGYNTRADLDALVSALKAIFAG